MNDLRDNNEDKLDGILAIFQVMQDDGEDEVVYGWGFHNLFSSLNINTGVFASSIFKPPVQTSSPIDMSALIKLDQKLEFEIGLAEHTNSEAQNNTNSEN